MRSSKTIHVISAHAEGEVGDVIVGGVMPPPGDTIWEQSRWIAQDQTLRNFVLNEPRGGVFRHVNLLVPPKHPEAVAAFIIMALPARRVGAVAQCIGALRKRAHHARWSGAGAGRMSQWQGGTDLCAELAELCRTAGYPA